MNDKCIHILMKGPRKGEVCEKIAWFPFFFRCYCRQHAITHNVPISNDEVNRFIKLNS